MNTHGSVENRTASQAGGTDTARWQWLRAGPWRWQVNTRFQGTALLDRLASPESLMRAPEAVLRPRNPPKPESQTARLVLPGMPACPLFVKRYRPRNAWQGLKDLFRPSRARRAFERAFLLQQLQIPTATPVAAGERRLGRWLQEAYLVTEEVPQAQCWLEHDRDLPPQARRIAQIRALARLMARLHDAGLVYTDPARTNFMLRFLPDGRAEMVLIDLDSLAARRLGSLGRIVRELRRVSARIPSSERERLFFLVQYCRARRNRLPVREVLRRLGPAFPVVPRHPAPATKGAGRLAL